MMTPRFRKIVMICMAVLLVTGAVIPYLSALS